MLGAAFRLPHQVWPRLHNRYLVAGENSGWKPRWETVARIRYLAMCHLRARSDFEAKLLAGPLSSSEYQRPERRVSGVKDRGTQRHPSRERSNLDTKCKTGDTRRCHTREHWSDHPKA